MGRVAMVSLSALELALMMLFFSPLPLAPTAGAAALVVGTLVVGVPRQAPAPLPVAVTAPAPAPMCKKGETRKADDGCNTCSCLRGQWACTQKVCLPGKTP